jgi:TolB-like protein/Tfp pilus assembly protein PilF
VSFIDELKRRNVFRVGIAYVIVAWLIAQVADLVLDNIDAPRWLMQAVLLLLGLGLPLALFFAWAFELTPEGLKKEKDVDRAQSITRHTGRKLDWAIMVVLVLALGYLGYDKFGATVKDPAARPAEGPVAAEMAQQAAATGVVATGHKSIAVLPFANRSNREEDAFFTEGIHDDLLTHLAKIGSLKVISRTSVLRYRDSGKSIPEIAAELNVGTVLEGGIQRSGDQVRINVQLIDAKTDEHLWAEIFDRQLTAENLFAIQSEISTAIATALEATLSPQEKSRLGGVPTSDMAAYNAYLRGRQLQARRKSADLEQAMVEFRRATELDPRYALAWVGVADTGKLLSIYATLPLNEALAMQEQAARKALAIDPDLGEAHASLADVYKSREQYAEAEAAFLRAIELSPNYASAYQWYSGMLSGMPDRLPEALAMMEQAAQLDPLSSIIQSNLGRELAALGRFDEAEGRFLRLIDLDPDFAPGYSGLADLYSFSLGRFAEGSKWLARAREKDPGNISLLLDQVSIRLNVGDEAGARALQRQMLDIDPQSWAVGAADMLANLSQGNYAGAIEAVQWIQPKLANLPSVQAWVAFTYLLNGDFARARELMAQAYPGWEDPHQWPRMIREQTSMSCVVAGIFSKSGDAARAEELVGQTIAYYDSLAARIQHADALAPLDCWALRGDDEQALAMLETQVAHGHIAGWWLNYQWPWWNELRATPRFQAAMQMIQDKVTEQRRLAMEPGFAL